MTIDELIDQIEIEGVDYALTQKIPLKEIFKIDKDLGELVESYQDLREQVLYRVGELGKDFEPLEYI